MKKTFCLILATLVICFSATGMFKNPLNKELDVQTIFPQKSAVDVTLNCTGKVIQAELQTVTLPMNCMIKEVYVKNNDIVKEGQLIASLTPMGDTKNLMETLVGNINRLEEIDLNDVMKFTGDMENLYSSALEIYQKSDENSKEILITSTVEGEVQALHYDANAILPALSNLCTIANNKNYAIEANIAEGYSDKIFLNQKVKVTIDACKEVIWGRITKIADGASSVYSGTTKEIVLPVIITLERGSSKMKSGYTAKLDIVTDSKEAALLIPYESITQNEKNEEIVYVRKQGRAVPCLITTGLELNENIEVTRGIGLEDEVILLTNEGSITPYQKIK